MGYSKLLYDFYKTYKPHTESLLNETRNRALKIPDAYLRNEALKSINGKTFHCYGASFYACLVPPHSQKAFLSFVVAYQTISDYLDNLIDQTTVINETNFRRLHQSMVDVFKLTPNLSNYYQYQIQQKDDGYLKSLVLNCQHVLKTIPHYERYAPVFLKLAYLYIDLQVFKHLKVSERELKLMTWYEKNKRFAPHLTWYEFSAAAGSTLGIFSLLGYAMNQEKYEIDPQAVYFQYFPSIQLLHIMLDYFIDLEEDLADGELNFFAYYESEEEGITQLLKQYAEANIHAKKLPNGTFHQTINDGLFALYLAEGHIKSDKIKQYQKRILSCVNLRTKILYQNAYFVMKQYHQMKKD